MKKLLISSFVLAASLLMAGGNKAPEAAPVSVIPNKCGTNTVYEEADTMLMWQDEAYTDAEDAAYKREHASGKAGSYQYAVNYCNALAYAGHSDWRLPTSDELVNVHRKEGQVFANFRDSDFWSSTAARKDRYYVVYPADAYQFARKPSESNFIRCVRCMKK